LLASATETRRAGRALEQRVDPGKGRCLGAPRRSITAVMPTISNLRRYLSPIFVIRPSLALPPVECWRGTRPSHAARWRPDRNSVAPEQKEEIAKAMAVNRATRRTEKRAWRKSKSSWCDPRMIHLCFRSDHSASERLHQRRQASQRGHPESTALMNGREEVPTTKLVRVSLVARILDPRIESCHHMTLLRNENAHATRTFLSQEWSHCEEQDIPLHGTGRSPRSSTLTHAFTR